MRHGRCELCHATADLCDSHFLPKAAYKRARATELKNPNPVVLSDGKAKQSSLQVRDYKFCRVCEKRFNDGGERWILDHIPENYGDGFKLQDTLLNAVSPVSSGRDDLLYPQTSIPEVDMEKLVYFALSIFWRATRHWRPVEGGSPERLYLSGRHESAIRAFLLEPEKRKLPKDVVVTVAVWPYNKVYPLATPPRTDAEAEYRAYWFYYHGFIFALALGRKIPALARRCCSYHSPEKFLAVNRGLARQVKNTIAEDFKRLDSSSLKSMFREIRTKRGTHLPQS